MRQLGSSSEGWVFVRRRKPNPKSDLSEVLQSAQSSSIWAIQLHLRAYRIAGRGLKGLAAGSVNLCFALLLGAHPLALRRWRRRWTRASPATASAWFSSSSPCENLEPPEPARTFLLLRCSASPSLPFRPEVPSLSFWVAAVLMALGIWLHIRERDEHPHPDEVLDHNPSLTVSVNSCHYRNSFIYGVRNDGLGDVIRVVSGAFMRSAWA